MDWCGLMQAGIGGLRLRPRDFWALTPAELQMMLGLTGDAAPMLRARLDDLLAAFPDDEKDMSNG